MAKIISGQKRRQQIEEELASHEEPARQIRTFSRLDIYLACAKLGIWDAIEAWLANQNIEGVNLLKAFDRANVLAEDHPLFATYIAKLASDLNIAPETIEQVLDHATVVAPVQ